VFLCRFVQLAIMSIVITMKHFNLDNTWSMSHAGSGGAMTAPKRLSGFLICCALQKRDKRDTIVRQLQTIATKKNRVVKSNRFRRRRSGI